MAQNHFAEPASTLAAGSGDLAVLKKSVSKPTSFLIVLMGSVGDVARALPLAGAIKKHNPQHTITWLVEPSSAQLVQLCPDIDRCIVFERKQGIRALPACVKKIRDNKSDIVLDLQRHLKSGFFSWMSRAPIRIGFHRRDSKEGNFLLQTHTIAQQNPQLNKFQHYGEFIRILGISPPTEARIALKLETATELREQLSGYDIITIVLGTRWETKRWPVEGYKKLLQLLSNRPEKIVLVGSKDDVSLSEEISTAAANVINLTGKTDLAGLCSVLRMSTIVIGPDSGPAHIAAGFDIPHVTLFGPTSPSRTAPFGQESLVVQSLVPCRECYRKKCPGLDTLCMRSIAPQRVLEKVISVLDGV